MKKPGLIVIDLQKEYLPTGKLPLSGIEFGYTTVTSTQAYLAK